MSIEQKVMAWSRTFKINLILFVGCFDVYRVFNHFSLHRINFGFNEHAISSVIKLPFFVCATVESTEQSDQLKQSLKEEKQTRKRLESKVDHIEEELNDLRHEKETLERVRVLSGTR